MDINPLIAISPIDGRYRNQVEELTLYFSEFALIRYRVEVEIEYFIALCNIPLAELKVLSKREIEGLKDIYRNFTLKDAHKVKKIEQITNHDVKAVEYFVKEKFDDLGLKKYREFVHFALTSQDINNTAIPLSIKHFLKEFYIPSVKKIIAILNKKAKEWDKIPLLSHTHGQPASPTKVGKEIRVFIERINGQLKLLQSLPQTSKFSGATGNFNAHYAAYPKIDWLKFAKEFQKKSFGLTLSYPTTQIEPYDNLSALFDNIKRINTILIDFSRDMWSYISMEYFGQKIKRNEVGSSTMPHKVNPIDFENAEGNLGVANSLFQFFSSKLPISRLQRDLTDSTTLRNIGVAFSHTTIAYNSIIKGVEKLTINRDKIIAELNQHLEVVAEGIQTILRREGYPNSYETLKLLTRGKERITKEDLSKLIDELKVSDKIKKELKSLSPENYTGKG